MMLLCRIGIHLPKRESCSFVDAVDGREVYEGRCSCGIRWLFNWTMKMRREKNDSCKGK